MRPPKRNCARTSICRWPDYTRQIRRSWSCERWVSDILGPELAHAFPGQQDPEPGVIASATYRPMERIDELYLVPRFDPHQKARGDSVTIRVGLPRRRRLQLPSCGGVVHAVVVPNIVRNALREPAR